MTQRLKNAAGEIDENQKKNNRNPPKRLSFQRPDSHAYDSRTVHRRRMPLNSHWIYIPCVCLFWRLQQWNVTENHLKVKEDGKSKRNCWWASSNVVPRISGRDESLLMNAVTKLHSRWQSAFSLWQIDKLIPFQWSRHFTKFTTNSTQLVSHKILRLSYSLR